MDIHHFSFVIFFKLIVIVFFSKVLGELVVVAGQVNLIDYDYSEERHAVFRVIPYDTFDNVTLVDDIALIEVDWIR